MSNYVHVVITVPADLLETLNLLIAATGAEGATDKTMGAPLWDSVLPVVVGADGWPNLSLMPPPDFYVCSGWLHRDALAQLPEDRVLPAEEPV